MQNKIIFIDGQCVLCNKFALFVHSKDKTKKIKFSTLQGNTFKKLSIPKIFPLISNLKTIIFYDGKNFYTQFDAILYILAECSLSLKVLSILLKIIPKKLRDLGYNIIAKFRYLIFGKKHTCQLPSTKFSNKILD